MEKRLSIQILLSTMYQEDYSILDRINLCMDAVVVNQCDKSSVKKFTYDDWTVLWIDTTERGLSKSRNMALKNSTADICVLADDDEIFLPDSRSNIEYVFLHNSNISIARFKIEGIEECFKTYPEKQQKVGYLKSMKISSVEIAFKREDMLKNMLCFDELIGAGTEFRMGEENAFLFHCLAKHLKILYVPIKIADLHIGESTWFDGYTEKYFIGRGAAFTAMNKAWSVLLILQFSIRRYSIYRGDMGFFDSIRYMLEGRKKYLIKKNQLFIVRKKEWII